MRHTAITIDLNALEHNLTRVKDFAPTAKILAMVKANAYGHGAVACLPAFAQADALGVACLAEAIELQKAGWEKPIVLIEGAFSFDEWQYTLNHHMQCVIHHDEQLAWALSQPVNEPVTVWLKFNTGMNRLGFDETQILTAANALHKAGYRIVLTSHFANADQKSHPTNNVQRQLFARVLTQLRQTITPNVQGALCNSAGIINFSDSHYDWVRPGIMLYGGTPVNEATAAELDLKPVMQFDAAIMAIHDLAVGDCVGYGSRWQATKPARIAIVSVGYADGYPRVITSDAYVVAESDKKLPIIGRVAMDMLMVDISDYPDLALGTPLQLWGNSPTIDEVASWNDTISYELLCLVTKRPTWQYLPKH